MLASQRFSISPDFEMWQTFTISNSWGCLLCAMFCTIHACTHHLSIHPCMHPPTVHPCIHPSMHASTRHPSLHASIHHPSIHPCSNHQLILPSVHWSSHLSFHLLCPKSPVPKYTLHVTNLQCNQRKLAFSFVKNHFNFIYFK